MRSVLKTWRQHGMPSLKAFYAEQRTWLWFKAVIVTSAIALTIAVHWHA